MRQLGRQTAMHPAQGASEDRSLKWNSLEHSGVLFPPEYAPHGVKMLYDGRPVDLTPEQEEVCANPAGQGKPCLVACQSDG